MASATFADRLARFNRRLPNRVIGKIAGRRLSPVGLMVHQGRRSYLTGASERLFRSGVALPSGSGLTDKEVERVTDADLRGIDLIRPHFKVGQLGLPVDRRCRGEIDYGGVGGVAQVRECGV